MYDLQMRTWAEVSLKNLEHNYRELRGRVPAACKFLAPVKADAYGHGAVTISRKLEELGADYLAVACLSEAVELRDAGIASPLLILGYTPPEYAPELARLKVTQAVTDINTAREMSRVLSGKGTVKIHVKLDTGMGRLGFHPENPSFYGSMSETLKLPGLDAEGIFTHFAVSDVPGDRFTMAQYDKFREIVDKLENISGHKFEIRHCANSGAVVNYPQLAEDMIRPGIALYGLYQGDSNGAKLRQVMELKTKIALIQERPAGESVSYGRTYFTDRRQRIAVLPIGYADGLPRILSNNMDVLVRGVRCPQVGRICMDMCMIDVTDVPDCSVGDAATVFGHDGKNFIPVEELADKAGTITYEIVCGVSRRVPRIYTD